MVTNFKLGLIGFPIKHSLSPLLHETMLKASGLAGAYECYPIHPDIYHERNLERLVGKIRMGLLHGLNVTIPYKRTVMRYVDELTHEAQTIGAVNLIHKNHGRIIGDNSDAKGFYSDLKRLGLQPEQASYRKALILGAGGAARAVAYCLLTNNWQVHVTSRRLEQVQELSKSLMSIGDIICLINSYETVNRGFDLIVNATPLGMIPNVNANPWPKGLPYPSNAYVYDMIYNPAETELIKTARLAGLQVSNGLGMLIEQAAISFETWTGDVLPREKLWQALCNALSEHNSLTTNSIQL